MDVLIVSSVGFFFLGAILASFGGVIVGRLYTGQSWVRGRSRCDSCSTELRAFDLIPIFSLLLSRGRCRSCKSRLSLLHSLSEIILGGLFVAAYLSLGLTASLPIFLAAVFVLYMLTLYDLRHTIVPPVFSTVLTILSFAFALIESRSLHNFSIVLMTAGGIGLAFFFLHLLSGGRAMGLGDAPVAFALSLLVMQRAVSGLVFSFWIGGLIGIFILVTRRKGHRMGIEVPFVPFLAAGYLLAFFTTWNPFAPW